mgnify:CR=1 FL=1
MSEEKARVTKIERGMEFGPEAYLYVPDPDEPSTWKLRIEETPGKITVAQLGRAAAALGPGFRGQRVDLPSEEDYRECARKLIRLYRDIGVEDEKIPEYLWGIAGWEGPKKASTAIRAWEDTEAELIIGGYGVVWGSPQQKDLMGEYFTKDSELMLDVWPIKPLFYHHGRDEGVQTEPIGTVKNWHVDDIGVWFEAQLNKHSRWIKAIKKLIEAGALHYSPGALDYLVIKKPDGHLKRWPIVELSLTPVPAQPYIVTKVKVQETYKALGLSFELPDNLNKEGEEMEEIRKEIEELKSTVASVAESVKALAASLEGLQKEPAVKAFSVVHKEASDWFDPETPLISAVKAILARKTDRAYLTFKAMGESTPEAGGYLVPPEYSRQLIELLSAQAVVRKAGATVVPMSTNVILFPKVAEGVTTYWLGENTAITPSDMSFAQVQLTVKKLAAMVPLSRELLADSSLSAEEIVRNDLARALALEEDIKFLRGDGTNNAPVGIRNITGVNIIELGTGNGATPTFDDLAQAIYVLDSNNAPTEKRAFIMHPRTANTLRKAKDSQGRYLWSDPARPSDPPTIWGYPVLLTTQIPINLTVGTSTDCSEIYFGAWGEALIGQRMSLEIRVSEEAGDAFAQDQVLVRAIMRVGFAVRYPEAFVVLTGVRP